MNLKEIISVLAVSMALACEGQTNGSKEAVPEKKDGHYIIKVQNQELEIDPAAGGRITSLKIEGRDFLTDQTVNDFNWGSTLWPSPQSEWKWPPSAELDNKPYTAEVKGGELKMVSQKDPKTGLVITKQFSGDEKAGCYTLKYTITNQSDHAQKVAPWEVTRVHTNGLAFYPRGNDEKRGGLIPLTEEKNGINWFSYKEDKLPVKGDRQLYSDGAEGWLAQVNDGIILVKKFADVPLEKNAPGEGEIELYASPVAPGKSYVEIEHQGAYEELQPGGLLTWEVTWFLRKLPAAIRAEPGNEKLTAYVRQLVR